MQTLAVGCWGAFFGCTVFSAAAALLAFWRSARKIAITGTLTALLPAVYALVFLDWLPLGDAAQLQHLRSLTAIACAAVLVVPLLLLLGVVRRGNALSTARWGMLVAALGAALLTSLVPAPQALLIGISVAGIIGVAGAVVSAMSALRGERTAWITSAALACCCTGMWGLDWFAVHPDRTPWQLHALSAAAGMGFLLSIAAAMWARYAYLIELSHVIRQGPGYDPVTRMRAYQVGRPLPDALAAGEPQTVGLVAVCIANLKALEELHGQAACNHALFVCASRLRRLSLSAVDMMRLGEDGFVLVLHHFSDVDRLVDLARTIERRLARPVHVGTTGDISRLEEEGALWQAALGVGVLVEEAAGQLEVAIAGARSMARTAWSFGSHIAWFDEAAGEIAELPA